MSCISQLFFHIQRQFDWYFLVLSEPIFVVSKYQKVPVKLALNMEKKLTNA